jgi:hypothetical protein
MYICVRSISFYDFVSIIFSLDFITVPTVLLFFSFFFLLGFSFYL